MLKQNICAKAIFGMLGMAQYYDHKVLHKSNKRTRRWFDYSQIMQVFLQLYHHILHACMNLCVIHEQGHRREMIMIIHLTASVCPMDSHSEMWGEVGPKQTSAQTSLIRSNKYWPSKDKMSNVIFV